MSKGLVLISGVNGYIAATLAKHLLECGYHVRGTVRRVDSANKLVEGPLKDFYATGKFQVVAVPDITNDGAFDEAVKGVTAIAHLASPVSMTFKDPAPILRTAVQGTNTILESARLHAGTQLQSVVVLSSIAAVRNATPAPYTFDEKDWNDVAEAICEQKGTEAPGGMIYAASKVAAEKAFWKFQKEKQPSFSMTSINPV
jgi:nucleoside-diphosphate-sugar epimerase